MLPANAMTAQATDPSVWEAALKKAESEGRKVELLLSNGSKVKGKPVAVHADRCEIQSDDATILVPYGQIESMRLKNRGLSRPVKYLIVFGAGLAGLLLAAWALGRPSSPPHRSQWPTGVLTPR